MAEDTRKEITETTVVALQGDLTSQDVDAIVNAANKQLNHGGGVAAAIVKAGGKVIQRESDEYIEEHGPLEPGGAAVTTAGDMPARMVVHVAGPVYDEDSDENAPRLHQAVVAALETAADAGARSIAFPAISAGVYGYPRDEATAVIVEAIGDWLRTHKGALDEVRLVGLDEETTDAFAHALHNE